MSDTSSPAPAKICIRCGQDCSKRPRTKDLQGRYTCRDCLEKAQKQAAAPAHQMAAPAGAARMGDPIPLEDAGDPNLMDMLLQDAVKEQAKVTASPCPGCGNPLRSDTAICVNCGYNTRTGAVVKTKQAKAEEINPEALAKAKGLQRERELAAAAARMEYIKPIIMIVAGLTITSLLLGSMEGGGGAATVGTYLMLYGISAFLTVVAYLLCVIMWLGSDAPLILIITRLMGICAVMDVLLVGIFARLPMGFGIIGLGYRYALPLIVYAAFLTHIMEIDWEEALMVGVITGVVKVVGTIMIWVWLLNTLAG